MSLITTSRRNVTGMMINVSGNHPHIALFQVFSCQWIISISARSIANYWEMWNNNLNFKWHVHIWVHMQYYAQSWYHKCGQHIVHDHISTRWRAFRRPGSMELGRLNSLLLCQWSGMRCPIPSSLSYGVAGNTSWCVWKWEMPEWQSYVRVYDVTPLDRLSILVLGFSMFGQFEPFGKSIRMRATPRIRPSKFLSSAPWIPTWVWWSSSTWFSLQPWPSFRRPRQTTVLAWPSTHGTGYLKTPLKWRNMSFSASGWLSFVFLWVCFSYLVGLP